MQYESWLFFFFQVNSTEVTHAAKPHVQMVKPFEPWFVGEDAKLAACSWQPVKITTSEENLINTLLNIMEGKICNSRRNSGHTRLQRRKKKKSFKLAFSFLLYKVGRQGREQGAADISHAPIFPQGSDKGHCLHPHSSVPSHPSPANTEMLFMTGPGASSYLRHPRFSPSAHFQAHPNHGW